MVDFEVQDQRIFALDDRLGVEHSKRKADDLKVKAFGLVSNLLLGAKKEDIDVTYVERRYEPFWHIVCSTHVEYDRHRQYKIDVDRVVRSVTVDGVEHEVKDMLYLDGLEHCVEDERKEIYINADSGSEADFSKHVNSGKREIKETEEIMTGDDIVVPAKVKASYLTRNILSEMLKPIKAHDVTSERIRMEKLHLYFRPVWAFEYVWRTKNKSATLEFDAVTLDYKPGGKTLRQKVREMISESDLFDIGGDVVNLFVPGTSIAVKLARKAVRKS